MVKKMIKDIADLKIEKDGQKLGFTGNLPRTDQLPWFGETSAYKSDYLHGMLQTGGSFEQAFFLHQHALQFSWWF